MTKLTFKVCLDGRKCLPKPLKILIHKLKLILPHDFIWKKRISNAKLRQNAMKVAAASPGVTSVAFVGEKNELVVTGNNVDAIHLTLSLRRKLDPSSAAPSPAQLLPSQFSWIPAQLLTAQFSWILIQVQVEDATGGKNPAILSQNSCTCMTKKNYFNMITSAVLFQ